MSSHINDKINITLLSTEDEIDNAIQKTAFAAYICTHKDDTEEFFNMSREDNEALISRVLAKGHRSILRHATFTFMISNVSRTLTHQLVRHTAGVGISQQSQRYTKLEPDDDAYYIIPPTIAESNYRERYVELMQNNKMLYSEMLADGIPAEDARFCLPNATKSNIIFSGNGETFFNLVKARYCNRSQWEIRDLASMIRSCLMSNIPCMFSTLSSNCKHCVDVCKNPIGNN